MPCHHHHLVIGATVSFLLIVAYFHHEAILRSVASMTKPFSTSTPLKVILSPSTSVSSTLGSAKIHITVENLSAHPVSILRWSSPLDLHAAAIGVFTFASTTTNTPAPCLDMKFNYHLPTSGYFAFDDENTIHIPGNGKIERDVEFKEPEIALTKEEKYVVKTQGSWTGVWIHDKVREGPRRLYLEDGDLMRGNFESNEIKIEIPGKAGAEL
jgi:hypothetical protein